MLDYFVDEALAEVAEPIRVQTLNGVLGEKSKASSVEFKYSAFAG